MNQTLVSNIKSHRLFSSIWPDLNNAVTWMVSSLPPIFFQTIKNRFKRTSCKWNQHHSQIPHFSNSPLRSKYFINWITMTRISGKHSTWHMEPLDNSFDRIRSHQQCIPWSPWLGIELSTTECRVIIIPLRYWSISLTSSAKLIYHGKCTVYTPVRPNRFGAAVQWFRMSHAVSTGFSGHGNLIYNI